MIRKKIAGSVECGVVTDRRRLRILDFLVKQGIPRQIKEKQNNDKSTFRLPRQEFFFSPNLLILCRFPYNRRVYYNDFTTFEKCSDMTKKEIVENEIFIPLYKFRNISFDFEK